METNYFRGYYPHRKHKELTLSVHPFRQTGDFESMKISVIIPAFNAATYLSQAVESIVETNHRNIEVLIVDDGSTDQTLDVAKGLQVRYPGLVRLYSHSRNLGAGAARNLGIMKSSGEVIAFLDADDWYLPYRFETSLRILETDQEVDGVFELTGLHFERDVDREKFNNFDEPIGGLGDDKSLLHSLCWGKCWSTNAITLRRSVFNRSGLFNTALKKGEDVEMWIRISAIAHLVAGNTKEPVTVYRRHSDNRAMPGRVEEMVQVLCEAMKWARNHLEAQDALSEIHASLLSFSYGNVDDSLRSGNVIQALGILKRLGVCFPQAMMHRQYWGNLIKVLRYSYVA